MTTADGTTTTPGGSSASTPGEAAVLTQFLGDLRSLGEDPAPVPSADLVALLGGATPIEKARGRRGHYARTLQRTALAAAAVIAGTTVAAASHNLPQPAQGVVSNVFNVLTPFHIDPSGHPTTVPAPSPVHRAPVVPEPSEGTTPESPASTEPADGGGAASSGGENDGGAPGSGGSDTSTGSDSGYGGSGTGGGENSTPGAAGPGGAGAGAGEDSAAPTRPVVSTTAARTGGGEEDHAGSSGSPAPHPSGGGDD